MENLNDTKLEDILNSLTLESDLEWSKNVEQNLKTLALSNQDKYTNNNYFINLFMKNKLIIASVAIVALSLVGISAVSVYLIGRTSNQSYTKAQTAAILAKVLEKNAATTFQEAGSLAPARSADSSKVASSLSIAPIPDDFDGNNYRYTKTVVENGPAVGKCTDIYEAESFNNVNENYEFRPNGGIDYKGYKYKYISYDQNDTLVSYNLSTYEGNNSINYDYVGGNYAVKNIYEIGPDVDMGRAQPLAATEPAVDPSVDIGETSPEPVEPDKNALVDQYFGPNAQIVGTIQEGNSTFYILQYSYDSSCNGNTTKFIHENKINQDSFAISSTKTFVESTDGVNLVRSTTIQIETSTISESEANQIFSFDANVPIREVVYPYTPYDEYSPEKEALKIIGSLKTKSLIALFPVDTYDYTYGYTTDDVNVTPKGSDYRSDRAFYPPSAAGEDLYKLYNGISTTSFISPESGWTFTKNEPYTSLSIESYKRGITQDEIIQSKLQTFIQTSGSTSFATQIKINGANVSATVSSFKAKLDYLLMKEDSVSSSSSEAQDSRLMVPPTNGEVQELEYTYVIFEYSGHYYVVTGNVYSGDTIKPAEVNLKSYDPANSIDAEFLKNELMKSYTTPISIENGDGTGDGSSSSPEIACTQEAKQCNDGSYVGRNSANNCEFEACP